MKQQELALDELNASQKRLLKRLDSFTINGEKYQVQRDYYGKFHIYKVNNE